MKTKAQILEKNENHLPKKSNVELRTKIKTQRTAVADV